MMESPEGWADVWTQFAANLEQGWSWSGFERSALFVNDGSMHFQDLGSVLGADQVADGRGLAIGDLDNDGDPDLVGTNSRTHPHAFVLRNDLETDRAHLFVQLEAKEYRSAAGAKILLTAGGVTQRRDVALGYGFLSQHDTARHFGLGDATTVERIEITWPDGERQTLTDVAVDQKIIVRQGSPDYERVAHTPRNANATRRLPEIEWDTYSDRLTLLSKPWPDLSWLHFTDAEGNRVDVLSPLEEGKRAGGPAVLVNLWATWCANCKREMPELIRIHEENLGGLRVVGLAMDGDEEAHLVEPTIEEWGINFPVKHVTGAYLTYLMTTLDEVVTPSGGLTLPTSLVLSPGGKVMAVAQGAIDVENLLRYLEQARE